MTLDDQLVKISVKKHTSSPSAISCRKGCASCCHQVVSLSPPEVFMLYDVVAEMPEARQEKVLTRFVETEEALEGAGLVEGFEEAASAEDVRALSLKYFALGLACPFLEGKTCSIYDKRPSMCREYLVTSPAQHCAELGKKPIRPVPMSLRMSEALGRVAARVLEMEQVAIPLSLAMRWAHAHDEEGQRRWGAQMLFEMLFAELKGH